VIPNKVNGLIFIGNEAHPDISRIGIAMCGRFLFSKVFFDAMIVAGCGHVSGLFCGIMAAGLDEVRVSDPYQVAGLLVSWQYPREQYGQNIVKWRHRLGDTFFQFGPHDQPRGKDTSISSEP